MLNIELLLCALRETISCFSCLLSWRFFTICCMAFLLSMSDCLLWTSLIFDSSLTALIFSFMSYTWLALPSVLSFWSIKTSVSSTLWIATSKSCISSYFWISQCRSLLFSSSDFSWSFCFISIYLMHLLFSSISFPIITSSFLSSLSITFMSSRWSTTKCFFEIALGDPRVPGLAGVFGLLVAFGLLLYFCFVRTVFVRSINVNILLTMLVLLINKCSTI